MAAKTFQELIAVELQTNPAEYALAIVNLFKSGDTAASKVVLSALEDSKYMEENKFPINDDRIKQIISMAAEQISSGEL